MIMHPAEISAAGMENGYDDLDDSGDEHEDDNDGFVLDEDHESNRPLLQIVG